MRYLFILLFFGIGLIAGCKEKTKINLPLVDQCAEINDSFTCKTLVYIDVRVYRYERDTRYQWSEVMGGHIDSAVLVNAHATFSYTWDNHIVNKSTDSNLLSSLIYAQFDQHKLSIGRVSGGIYYIWNGISQDYYGNDISVRIEKKGKYYFVDYGGVDWVGSSGGSKTYYSFVLKEQ